MISRSLVSTSQLTFALYTPQPTLDAHQLDNSGCTLINHTNVNITGRSKCIENSKTPTNDDAQNQMWNILHIDVKYVPHSCL